MQCRNTRSESLTVLIRISYLVNRARCGTLRALGKQEKKRLEIKNVDRQNGENKKSANY